MASITTHPYFIAIVCNLMMLDCGFIEFTTYYESWKTLTTSRSQIQMKLWATYLGVVIGALMSVFMIDKLGRKSTLLLTALPKTLGWLLHTLSEKPTDLILGQITTGIGCGMVYATLPIYLCEITTPDNRGSIGILMSVFFNLGPLLNVAFKKNPYWNEAFLTVILPIVYSMCHKWMFESPEFFAKMLEGGLAKKTLEYILRKENVEEEVEELINRVNITEQDSSLKNSFKALFGKSENRKALMMAIILISGMNFIGWFPVHKIISRNDGSFKLLINPWIIATSILSGIGSMILLPKLKKKYILSISGFLIISDLMLSQLIGLGDFSTSTRNNLSSDRQYVLSSLLCRLIYTFGCGFALNSIPFVYIGEIFSSKVKALGVVICIIFYAITKPTFLICNMIIGTQMSVPAYKLYEIGTVIVLFVLSAICVLETEGKSLLRIQRDLKS